MNELKLRHQMMSDFFLQTCEGINFQIFPYTSKIKTWIAYFTSKITPRSSNNNTTSTFFTPWIGGCGKNLWPFGDISAASNEKKFFPISIPAGTYFFSGTASGVNNVIFYYSDESDSISGIVNTTITFEKEVNAVSWLATNIINIQLEKGTTKTSYEPYENLLTISGITGINIGVNTLKVPTFVVSFEDQQNDGPGPVYQGFYNFLTGELVIQSIKIECGETLSPLINGRTSTGGYANIDEGLYFETGWLSSRPDLFKYAAADRVTLSERAFSDTLKNGCENYNNTNGYFYTWSSNGNYEDETPIQSIGLSLPSYCGSTLEQKRAYLKNNPITIIYPLKNPWKFKMEPAFLSFMLLFMYGGINPIGCNIFHSLSFDETSSSNQFYPQFYPLKIKIEYWGRPAISSTVIGESSIIINPHEDDIIS